MIPRRAVAIIATILIAGGCASTAQASAIHAARVAVHHWTVQDHARFWEVTGCHRHDARTTYCHASEYGMLVDGTRTTVDYVVSVRRGAHAYRVIPSLWPVQVFVPVAP